MKPLYKGHNGTLETVLYIEVVLNSEVIYSGTSLYRTHWDLGNCPLYRGCLISECSTIFHDCQNVIINRTYIFSVHFILNISCKHQKSLKMLDMVVTKVKSNL